MLRTGQSIANQQDAIETQNSDYKTINHRAFSITRVRIDVNPAFGANVDAIAVTTLAHRNIVKIALYFIADHLSARGPLQRDDCEEIVFDDLGVIRVVCCDRLRNVW